MLDLWDLRSLPPADKHGPSAVTGACLSQATRRSHEIVNVASRNHTVLSTSWSHFPRREQSLSKCVLSKLMLILRNTAGRRRWAQVPQSAARRKALKKPQPSPNKAAVCGVLDQSLLAVGRMWTEFLLNEAHSESSQVLLHSVPANRTICYQPTARAADKCSLILSLGKPIIYRLS